jgi:enamine deaminase RidA (YjgF/YER057c/UK114 family)
MELRRVGAGARMSQAVVHGGVVYLAGQVAKRREEDVVGQTRQVLAAIDELLAAAGSSRASMLSATVWLAHIGDFDAMNAVWDAWVPAGLAPARACVESRLARPDILVEIRVIAALEQPEAVPPTRTKERS